MYSKYRIRSLFCITYQTLTGFYTEEKLFGRVYLYNRIDSTCRILKGGNPRLNLPSAYTSDLFTIDLPERSQFGFTSAVTSPPDYFVWGETLYLKNSIASSKCIGIDIGNHVNVIGTLANSSTQVRYARYLEIDENTLDKPSPNGGGDLIAVGGVCANPAMSFINGE